MVVVVDLGLLQSVQMAPYMDYNSNLQYPIVVYDHRIVYNKVYYFHHVYPVLKRIS